MAENYDLEYREQQLKAIAQQSKAELIESLDAADHVDPELLSFCAKRIKELEREERREDEIARANKEAALNAMRSSRWSFLAATASAVAAAITTGLTVAKFLGYGAG